MGANQSDTSFGAQDGISFGSEHFVFDPKAEGSISSTQKGASAVTPTQSDVPKCFGTGHSPEKGPSSRGSIASQVVSSQSNKQQHTNVQVSQEALIDQESSDDDGPRFRQKNRQVPDKRNQGRQDQGHNQGHQDQGHNQGHQDHGHNQGHQDQGHNQGRQDQGHHQGHQGQNFHRGSKMSDVCNQGQNPAVSYYRGPTPAAHYYQGPNINYRYPGPIPGFHGHLRHIPGPYVRHPVQYPAANYLEQFQGLNTGKSHGLHDQKQPQQNKGAGILGDYEDKLGIRPRQDTINQGNPGQNEHGKGTSSGHLQDRDGELNLDEMRNPLERREMEKRLTNDLRHVLLLQGGQFLLSELGRGLTKLKIKVSSPQDFLLRHTDKFRLSDSGSADGQKKWVIATTDLKICERHVSKSGCTLGKTCDDLHVCKFNLLTGICKAEQQGKQCKYGHNLEDPHNRSLLKDHSLEGLPLPCLNVLFQRNRSGSMYPKVCKFFNNVKGCQKGGTCLSLHVCKHYILGDCVFGQRCRNGHSLYSPQPMNILRMFGFDVTLSQQENITELRNGLSLGCDDDDASVDEYSSVTSGGPSSISGLSLDERLGRPVARDGLMTKGGFRGRGGERKGFRGSRGGWRERAKSTGGRGEFIHERGARAPSGGQRGLPYSERFGRDKQSFQDGDLPDFWDLSESSNSGFQLVEINKQGSSFHEYEKIETQFFETLRRDKYRIERIQRIQNPDLYKRFEFCKKRMEKRAPSGAVEEKLLFHGTQQKYINAICHQGFDFRVSGSRTACLFGRGSYFAKGADYSRRYTDSHQLFVARVLVGRYEKGESDYSRPPPLNPYQRHGEAFDSCVDDVQHPKIFVVFAIEQAYPEYLIDFKKVMV